MSKGHSFFGFAILALMLIHWLVALFFVPVDVNQGEVYRIIYIHVPGAMAAFFCAALLLVASIRCLGSAGSAALPFAKASTEVGLIFTIITLASGSIWGRPTWGVWWTWDARLTTTLLLAILFCGWLLLESGLPAGRTRARSCGFLGIMIAADVPIIYKSVTWWRTLHQPQSILRPGGGTSTMDPEMLCTLVAGIFLSICLSIWLISVRKKNILLQDELDQRSLMGV
jgi:heme exporter protein C